MKTSTMKNKIKSFLIVLFWIFVWQILSLLIPEEILFVSPLKVIPQIIKILTDKVFYVSLFASISKITTGFLIGVFFATILSIISYKNTLFKELSVPLMMFLKSVPVVSFIVLALFFVSSKYLSIIISMIIATPIVYSNLIEGLISIDENYLDMAKIFDVSFNRKLNYIYLSHLKPFIISGLSLAFGMAWKSGLAAEVISLPNFGIGTLIYNCKIYLDTVNLFAYTIIAMIVCHVLEKLLLFLIRRICK